MLVFISEEAVVTEKQWAVAVVGALGMVGKEMTKTLEMRGFPVGTFRPLDVARLAGTPVEFAGRTWRTEAASAESFEGVELAIFSAGAEASLELAPQAVAKGAVVVDNSSAWRMNPECPLVVPEVNPHDLAWHKGIIANPNCSTIQMVVALKPLHDAARIRRIVASTYQAASGAGQQAFDELVRQARQLAAGEPLTVDTFQYQLLFNVIPHIDVFQDGVIPKRNGRWSTRPARSWATSRSASARRASVCRSLRATQNR